MAGFVSPLFPPPHNQGIGWIHIWSGQASPPPQSTECYNRFKAWRIPHTHPEEGIFLHTRLTTISPILGHISATLRHTDIVARTTPMGPSWGKENYALFLPILLPISVSHSRFFFPTTTTTIGFPHNFRSSSLPSAKWT